jgi:hypothetical protein
MEPTARRARPLPLQVSGGEVVLLAAEANLLIDAVGRLIAAIRRQRRPVRNVTAKTIEAQVAELEALQQMLAAACGSLADRPLEISGDRARFVREALSLGGAVTAGTAELQRRLRSA